MSMTDFFHDLTRFFDHLAVAYFSGHPVYRVAQKSKSY